MIDQGAEAAQEAAPAEAAGLDADSERRLREALQALEAARARLQRALADG
jgi:hypothetical protein